MYIITLSFSLIYNIIIISEVKERNHGDANTHSCIHILLSQIISICERENRLKNAILKPKITRILSQTANLNRKTCKIEKKKALFKRIYRQKCCQERGLQYGKTW